MDEKIKELLDEEIRSQIIDLASFKSGSKELGSSVISVQSILELVKSKELFVLFSIKGIENYKWRLLYGIYKTRVSIGDRDVSRKGGI